MNTSLQQAVERTLSRELNKDVRLSAFKAIGGGCINNTHKLETNVGDFFLKYNNRRRYPGMFEAEAKGLELLATANAIKIPEVIATGEACDDAFLILEYIQSGSPKSDFWESFGRQLAELHRSAADSCGLDLDNYIGSLPQSNTEEEIWAEFFIQQRLEPQLKLASEAGMISTSLKAAFQNFYKLLPEIFPEEPPALLHGDLWSGNFMTDSNNEAVLIDPAVYYGHREMDLGMSKLFGGFTPAFYDAYNEAWPMETGWEIRLDFCNLYPLLVHVNLFGGGYVSQVEGIVGRFA